MDLIWQASYANFARKALAGSVMRPRVSLPTLGRRLARPMLRRASGRASCPIEVVDHGENQVRLSLVQLTHIERHDVALRSVKTVKGKTGDSTPNACGDSSASCSPISIGYAILSSCA